MEQLFTFPARIDDIADHAREVIDALGEGFGGALVLAAVHEALVNAVVYGALRIPPPAAPRDLDALFGRIHLAEAEHAGERIEASISRSDEDRVVRISDPGPGFDWRAWLSSGRCVVPPSLSWSNIPTHGRGLVIMQAGSKAMWWNEPGNEVSMRFRPASTVSRTVSPRKRFSSGVEELSNRRLLVVAQEAACRVGLRRAIQALGYDVRECDDPHEVLPLVESWAPGLVLVHVSLAGHAELLRGIAGQRGGLGPVPIAFATTRVDPELLCDALQSGARDLLQLPMWKTDLEKRLRSAIAPDGGLR